jgi:ABC-type uncharacterized transport system YnjBCD ATPase subunit
MVTRRVESESRPASEWLRDRTPASTGEPGTAIPVTHTARTVTGPVPAHELGHIASHEHLLCDLRPKAADGWTDCGALATEPISLQNYYEIRRQDFNIHNLVLDSEEDALAELQAFRAAGGDTVVDLTPGCIGRDPEALRRLSQATGVHIVMGCGWYVHEFHGDKPHRLSVGELQATMVGDLREGQYRVPAGVIGEIGLSWPVMPCEDAVLHAAVRSQLQTGACLVIHPGRHPLAAFGVESGDVVCIIGPSGSGKSTFLRCINHLESIDVRYLTVSGDFIGYKRDGNRLRELREREVAKRRMKIGMVFQYFNLFPHTTVIENLAEAPERVFKRSKHDAREERDRLLERVGLPDKANAYPGALSEGQEQRLAIARPGLPAA